MEFKDQIQQMGVTWMLKTYIFWAVGICIIFIVTHCLVYFLSDKESRKRMNELLEDEYKQMQFKREQRRSNSSWIRALYNKIYGKK